MENMENNFWWPPTVADAEGVLPRLRSDAQRETERRQAVEATYRARLLCKLDFWFDLRRMDPENSLCLRPDWYPVMPTYYWDETGVFTDNWTSDSWERCLLAFLNEFVDGSAVSRMRAYQASLEPIYSEDYLSCLVCGFPWFGYDPDDQPDDDDHSDLSEYSQTQVNALTDTQGVINWEQLARPRLKSSWTVREVVVNYIVVDPDPDDDIDDNTSVLTA